MKFRNLVIIVSVAMLIAISPMIYDIIFGGLDIRVTFFISTIMLLYIYMIAYFIPIDIDGR